MHKVTDEQTKEYEEAQKVITQLKLCQIRLLS